MKLYSRLAVVSTLATITLIAIGGLVRATKSGLGCGTDWPDCGGRLVPALETRAEIIEFSHRAMASVVVVLLASLAVVAVRNHRSQKHLLWGAVGAFGLVLVQAALGAVVVKLELEAISVVLHLGVALSLLAVLMFVTVSSLRSPDDESDHDRSLARPAATSAAFVLALLLLGSYVSGREAGSVFEDWPLMNGRLFPDLSHELVAIHFLHRAFAAVTGVVLVASLWRVLARKTGSRLQQRIAHAAVGGFALEVLIGAANVWSDLNAAFVSLHLFTGALIWGTLVSLWVVSRPAPEERTEVVARKAALQGGRP